MEHEKEIISKIARSFEFTIMFENERRRRWTFRFTFRTFTFLLIEHLYKHLSEVVQDLSVPHSNVLRMP